MPQQHEKDDAQKIAIWVLLLLNLVINPFEYFPKFFFIFDLRNIFSFSQTSIEAIKDLTPRGAVSK